MEAFQYTMYFFPRQVFCIYSPDLSGFFYAVRETGTANAGSAPFH